jgi:hypothetical protein
LRKYGYEATKRECWNYINTTYIAIEKNKQTQSKIPSTTPFDITTTIRFMTPPRRASKAGGDAPRRGRSVMSGSTAIFARAEMVGNFGPDEEMVAGTMQERFGFAWE